ncbi:MAG TPA: methyltransferase domain-containing protein [Steroidobacteraceae bacterium]|nr:methyltransferase domain-containing protein [Steroidobacteraceae bacterium]
MAYPRLLVHLKYLRTTLFYSGMRPFQSIMRKRRMAAFVKNMNLRENSKILDLGGQPMIWSSVNNKLDITILNLPGIAQQHYPSHHNFTYVEGDACNVAGFADASFDLVFSNSVIEHVGDETKQAQFAHEVRRLGRSYWVQTPSKYFPIEAHSGMPFWWFYPASVQAYFKVRWRKKLPDWTEMIEETRVLSVPQLKTLFPDASIKKERLLGISKSYVAMHLH